MHNDLRRNRRSVYQDIESPRMTPRSKMPKGFLRKVEHYQKAPTPCTHRILSRLSLRRLVGISLAVIVRVKRLFSWRRSPYETSNPSCTRN